MCHKFNHKVIVDHAEDRTLEYYFLNNDLSESLPHLQPHKCLLTINERNNTGIVKGKPYVTYSFIILFFTSSVDELDCLSDILRQHDLNKQCYFVLSKTDLQDEENVCNLLMGQFLFGSEA